MKLQVVEPKDMVHTGRGLMRILQAVHTPPLDLLVREAVQNSLDAAAPGVDRVIVDFRDWQIDADGVAAIGRHLPEICQRLTAKFSSGAHVLEIRDLNTQGLTGELRRHSSCPDGNLRKLVYDVSNPQDRAHAGGSWGLGKTCYFRMGIGLVIYYSRIRTGSTTYQSRLVACLVEDLEASGEDALLRSIAVPDNTGIAWWGDRDEHLAQSLPLIDTEEIGCVLSDLGVEPFAGEDVGTSIIIPFLRNDLTEAAQLAPESEDDETPSSPPMYWARDFRENIEVVLQRWYAPRIDNRFFGAGPWLDARVCGTRIEFATMSPLAQLMQRLYCATPLAASGANVLVEPLGPVGPLRACEKIKLRKTLAPQEDGEMIAGWVSWYVADAAALRMVTPHNSPDPSAWISGTIDHRTPPSPVFAMCRSVGMIVNYAHAGEEWTQSVIPRTGARVVGLFVLNGKAALVDELRAGPTLEGYVRSTEAATHDSWEDRPGGFDVIRKIRKNVAKTLKGSNEAATENAGVRRHVGASQFLGKLLMPSGFGHEPTRPPASSSRPSTQELGRPTGSAKPHRRSTIVRLETPNYEAHGSQRLISIPFELECGPEGSCAFELLVARETGTSFDALEWATSVAFTQFPFAWHRVDFLSEDARDTQVRCLNCDASVVDDGGFQARWEVGEGRNLLRMVWESSVAGSRRTGDLVVLAREPFPLQVDFTVAASTEAA